MPSKYSEKVGMYFLDLINTKSKGLLAKLFTWLRRDSLNSLILCADKLAVEESFVPRITETTALWF